MTGLQKILLILAILIALAAGWWGRGNFSGIGSYGMEHPSNLSIADGPCPSGADALYWKAPMDPNYIRDEPGLSPMGMALVPECPPAMNGEGPAQGQVLIDSATIQNIGVRTMKVERRDLTRSVRAVGRVAFDERRVVHVHTKVQGWVERLFIDFVGQNVKRGEPLLEIYSPELVATQEELLLAARYREDTSKSPFDDVREGGESLLETTKRRLALWDIPERDIERLLATGRVKRTLTLYAPAEGVVTQLGVRSGMEVKPNSNLYTIADLSRVWVLANVYEYELPWLEVGQPASVELSYLPTGPMAGELTYIAPFLDPKTRTVEVRVELDNSSLVLKPEMFGNMIIDGAPRPNVLVIPTEAVIRSGRRMITVVSLGDGRFEPREVELGLDSGDGWFEVRSGLAEGDEIVVSSQFLIDSESNLQEALKKLLAGAAATRTKKDASISSPTSPPSAHSMDEE